MVDPGTCTSTAANGHESCRDQVRALRITPHVARRDTEHGSGLGVYQWAVEGASALLHRGDGGCRSLDPT